MQLAPLNSSLTANKSWFFFDDVIVFLTNSIRGMTGNRVETIVNQWPVSSANASYVSGGKWAACDGVGYWFPAGTPFTKRETRSGTWAQLGASTDTTLYSATFQTIWFDHGITPVNATAEYAIVPNATSSSMAAWTASNPISILANDSTVSVVRNNRDDSRGFVFWTAGSYAGVQADAPAVVYISNVGTKLRVSVADPLAAPSGTIHVTIPGLYSAPGTTAKNRSTTIDVPRNGGKTFTITLSTPLQTRRRAVR
jgi:hyaluronate lyase